MKLSSMIDESCNRVRQKVSIEFIEARGQPVNGDANRIRRRWRRKLTTWRRDPSKWRRINAEETTREKEGRAVEGRGSVGELVTPVAPSHSNDFPRRDRFELAQSSWGAYKYLERSGR